jgi:RHS repeat-associated protein
MLTKKVFYCLILMFFGCLQVFGQSPQSNYPVVLPDLSQENYIVSSGETRQITSSQSITLLPGTWFKAGSNVSVKIANAPGTTGTQLLRSYVRQEIIKVGAITNEAQIDALTTAQKQTIYNYSDGLGRTVQTVSYKASPQQHDIIQPAKYDDLGRQAISYLPYAASTGSGDFRPNALSEQAAFYSNGMQDKVADDSSPYSQQVFDNSPLQKLLQAGTVGNGFQPGQHAKIMSYRSNTTTDNVMQWDTNGGLAGNYAVNTLNVTQTTDEQGAQVITFTDHSGQIVLKRQLANEVIAGVSQTYFDTYYVYNNAGAISHVIPPKATALIVATNYALTQPEVRQLLFIYKYDERGRVIEKTLPGAGPLYTIYDPLNRPVLFQNGNLRNTNQWNYIKYDGKNRAVSQGIYTDNTRTTLAAMQAYVNSLDYSTTWFEGRSNNVALGYYTNSVFPNQNSEALAYSYYDDYDLDGNGAPDYTYQTQSLSNEGVATGLTRGMLTMVRQRTVGSGLAATWLSKIMFYDKQGILIQTRSNSQLNAAINDSQTQVPDFTGKPLLIKTVKVNTTVLTTYNYDHADRITAVDQSYNGAAAIRVAGYSYNELGQLIDKQLHSVNGGTSFLQSVDYRYNIRGQLLSLNNSTLTNDGGTTNDDNNDVFGLQLLYDKAENGLNNTSYYNGMISAAKWIARDGSNQSGLERSYRYNYDALQRLKDALYADRPLSGGAWANLGGFDEKEINYDAGGNILALKRSALISGIATPIDDLQYSYDGNRLINVADGTGGSYNALGFKNLTSSAAVYTYDDNGSLLTDPKKGINLTCNVLGKTDRVTVNTAANRYLTYTYNADGTVLRKQQYDAGILQKTTDYIDGFVFENNTLAYFAMPEGRVRSIGNSLKPEYIITDQQGNARVSFEDNAGTTKVVQENSYYAFGLVMSGSPVSTPSQPNKNLYNGGAEVQDDFADLPDLHQTFYRLYDATLGRWTGTDPKAEAAENLSTYHYAGNNPVMYNDPLGDEAQYVINDDMRELLLGFYNHSSEGETKYNNSGNGWWYGNGFLYSTTRVTYRGINETDAGPTYTYSFKYFPVSLDPVYVTNGNTSSYQRAHEQMQRQMDELSEMRGSEGITLSGIQAGIRGSSLGLNMAAGVAVVTSYGAIAGMGAIAVEGNFVAGAMSRRVAFTAGMTAAANMRTTVLGHYPEYLQLAEEMGAKKFQIPTNVWNKMSESEQWGANTKYLDRMISRGDNIRLATPIEQVKPGSFYQRELNYLFDKGYKLSSDGQWLIK